MSDGITMARERIFNSDSEIGEALRQADLNGAVAEQIAAVRRADTIHEGDVVTDGCQYFLVEDKPFFQNQDNQRVTLRPLEFWLHSSLPESEKHGTQFVDNTTKTREFPDIYYPDIKLVFDVSASTLTDVSSQFDEESIPEQLAEYAGDLLMEAGSSLINAVSAFIAPPASADTETTP